MGRRDLLLTLPLDVCNSWAKNAAIGIDRGTADWLRDDARLAAPNTYGSFWDAANRGNRLVDARRTVVIANGASRQWRHGRNGVVRLVSAVGAEDAPEWINGRRLVSRQLWPR